MLKASSCGCELYWGTRGPAHEIPAWWGIPQPGLHPLQSGTPQGMSDCQFRPGRQPSRNPEPLAPNCSPAWLTPKCPPAGLPGRPPQLPPCQLGRSLTVQKEVGCPEDVQSPGLISILLFF
uniref:Uncharacterized protein n=1 Tax=Myotis myotis TaxID=51298 RepID=A0A7J7R1W9_MYOMY|nr:hypothetical protein mMyoMyo1_011220 [Myotis myotis]